MTPSHMFTLVKLMNEAFGNSEGNARDLEQLGTTETPSGLRSIYNEFAWDRLQKQCENIGGKLYQDGDRGTINGEVLELLEALEQRDIEGVRDALCDIMVFALGAYHFMGYDADADMAAVVEGVMTRFCRNDTEVEQTLQKWRDKGVDKLTVHGTFPRCYVKSAADQTAWNGEFIPKGKFLKSVGYRDTIFPPAPVKGISSRKFIGMPGK